MKSTWGWYNKGNGTNYSGFSGLPGGLRNNLGTFNVFGKYGYWWSATEYVTDFAINRYLYYSDDDLSMYNYDKEGGLSVRCVKD